MCRNCHGVLRWRNAADASTAHTPECAANGPVIWPDVAKKSKTPVHAEAAGVALPPAPQASPELFPCAIPQPHWVPDGVSDMCALCEEAYSTFTRRHHCRGCGRCVCGRCGSTKIPLPELGLMQPCRVCDDCSALGAMNAFDL